MSELKANPNPVCKLAADRLVPFPRRGVDVELQVPSTTVWSAPATLQNPSSGTESSEKANGAKDFEEALRILEDRFIAINGRKSRSSTRLSET